MEDSKSSSSARDDGDAPRRHGAVVPSASSDDNQTEKNGGGDGNNVAYGQGRGKRQEFGGASELADVSRWIREIRSLPVIVKVL